MIRQIELEARATGGLTGRPELSPRVLAALARVPRHEFVPEELKSRAYDDGPLPIGHGQTISQPFVVALMTDLAAVSETSRVLEIGTGCGYQTALLAELAHHVFTIEIVPELAAQAHQRLLRLGYTRVKTRVGDGHLGWPEEAPFDAILVTAAASVVPPALLAQLKPRGRLVIPVGRPFSSQDLVLIERDTSGALHEQVVLPVAFVPLVHGQGPA
ncbi:MAG TPA: protein-L-isoaspartate O-methyltransferase [Deltaproteobacteria bacterium]|jgi:protein-L-isoaspartate(D-aspartate) O-methyltransferase|nr:protein-L-isoaspartate O-methyltransferase [Deltaproteobacteria bacterium]